MPNSRHTDSLLLHLLHKIIWLEVSVTCILKVACSIINGTSKARPNGEETTDKTTDQIFAGSWCHNCVMRTCVQLRPCSDWHLDMKAPQVSLLLLVGDLPLSFIACFPCKSWLFSWPTWPWLSNCDIKTTKTLYRLSTVFASDICTEYDSVASESFNQFTKLCKILMGVPCCDIVGSLMSTSRWINRLMIDDIPTIAAKHSYCRHNDFFIQANPGASLVVQRGWNVRNYLPFTCKCLRGLKTGGLLPRCGNIPETQGPWSAHSITHISMKRVAYLGNCLLNHSRLMTSPTL